MQGTALASYTTNKLGYYTTGVTPVQMVSSVAQKEEVNADMLQVGCTAAQVCRLFFAHLAALFTNVLDHLKCQVGAVSDALRASIKLAWPIQGLLSALHMSPLQG